MSHIWMSYVTSMNESFHTYEWVMSHVCMSHITQIDESLIWIGNITRMNGSCPLTQRGVNARKFSHTHLLLSCCRHHRRFCHIWIESCHTYEWVHHMYTRALWERFSRICSIEFFLWSSTLEYSTDFISIHRNVFFLNHSINLFASLFVISHK